ncbi:MAG: hypothetical protein OXH66_19400 [Gemmatimonadetes bacterium]|nr:hypothetical protein [Gemmatimonadota bacterium]MYE93178.1 hypothetical protein [Gemmatimonadota bacterium]MYJ11281.1 hypothetical protein [Gemmatimonadota bacterium]
MWYRRVLLAAMSAMACDSPVAPLVCDEPLPVYAIREYPMKYEICFDSPGGEALTYTAKSSDTVVVTADVADDMLIVTGQSVGEALVTVTARATSGAVRTVDYHVVSRNALDGEVTKCVMTPAVDEGTDFDLDYWLRANVDVVNVVVRVTLGGIDGGARSPVDMRQGQLIDFYESGWMRDTPAGHTCRLDLDYEVSG